MSTWNGVPLEVTYEIERVSKKDLPTLLGKSPLLDEQISQALLNNTCDYVWMSADVSILNNRFIPLLKDFDTDIIIVEMELLCSGWFHPGTWMEPPDYNDEREMVSVTLSDDKISKSVEDKYFDLFYNTFKRQIESEEIDKDWYE